MSRYLIDQLATRSNISVLFGTELAAVHGDTSLQAIDVHERATAETTRLDSGGLFILLELMPRRHGCRPRSLSTATATCSPAPTC